MKFIKIFLASSVVEFEAERRQMGDFIRTLNDTYVKRGIYFELTICEDVTNSIAKERKQQEYNDIIRKSQYFYILFGRKAGEYTIEEFDVALQQFQESGTPRIFTYFMSLPEGERAEQGVVDFMERLDRQLGHYYSMFTHLDAVKLNLLLELVRDPELGGQMKFEDGQAVLNDRPMLSLENVPLYGGHETVRKLKKEQEEQNEEFARLAAEYGRHPENTNLLAQMMQLGEQRTRTLDNLHRLEMDMLGLCREVAEKRQAGRHLNWREKKAIERVDLGDYEGAKNILRDAKWEQEVEQAEEMIETAKEPVREYISGKKALIATLRAGFVESETTEEICRIYDRICELALKHGVEPAVLWDYADFLRQQRCYPEGIQVAERLRDYYRLNPPEREKQAKLLRLLGTLYEKNGAYEKAEPVLREAMELARGMYEGGKQTEYHKTLLADCCNAMGVFLWSQQCADDSKEMFERALSLRRELAAANPARYERELALSCYNMAIAMEFFQQISEAQKLYEESLAIRRCLAAAAPEVDEAAVARSLNALGDLLVRQNRFAEAEPLYEEALSISRHLAELNPPVYEADVAGSLLSLASLKEQTDCLAEAEELYREALSIRRRLAGVNPAVYEVKVAEILRSLAGLMDRLYRVDEAEEIHREALSIYRRLAAANPTVYEEKLATALRRTARFYFRLWHLPKAEELCREALAINGRLADQNPEVYGPDLAKVSGELASILTEQNKNPEEAHRLGEEALSLRRRLAKANPAVYEAELAQSCKMEAVRREECEPEESEALYREAQSIFQHLAEANPKVYEAELASVCNTRALFWEKRGDREAAEGLLRYALEIRRRLAASNPAAYEADVAKSCHDLGMLLKEESKSEAEPLLYEAWQVYQRLAERFPKAYDAFLSPVAFNLAELLSGQNRKTEAVPFYREALAADYRLAESQPGLYAAYPADTAWSLAECLCESGRSEEGRKLYEEALALYEAIPGKKRQAEYIRNVLKTQF